MMNIISGAPSGFFEKWCAYSQRTPGAVVYVGFCKAAKLLQFPDARQNRTWLMLCQHDPLLITIAEGFFDTEEKARSVAADLIAAHSPTCNVAEDRRLSQIQGLTRGPVICEQTQETFPSAAAAARAVGANASAMAQHLAGSAGYRTVRGMTFRRV